MNQSYSFLFPLLFVILLGCGEDDSAIKPTTIKEVSIIAELPLSIRESSGMVCSDSAFILTHNDSGDLPRLYQVNLNNKSISKTIHLKDVAHIDWEAITQDENYTYIGDIGNNNGDRTNLAIHKASTIDLQNNDSISVNTISYVYADQSDFSSRTNHNFDCEAMIALGTHLYLFSKNRANDQTDIYQVPKTIGSYELQPQGSLPVDGFITAAAINPSKTQICLLGYNVEATNYSPFLLILYDFPAMDFLNGKQQRIDLDLMAKVEAVDYIEDHFIYFTDEANGNEQTFVYGLDLSDFL